MSEVERAVGAEAPRRVGEPAEGSCRDGERADRRLPAVALPGEEPRR